MFRLGRQVESALLALRAVGESPNEGMSISEICLNYGLSKNTLSKLMQSLQSYGILASSQGVRGGYKLTKSLESISFFSVLDALGEIKHLQCRGADGKACDLSENCTISSPLSKWEERFEEHLKNTKLSELLFDDNPPQTMRSL